MKNKILSQISGWWNTLLPKQRKTIVLALAFTSVAVIALFGWSQSRAKIKPVNTEEPKKRKDISIETGMLEKKRELDNQAEVERLKKQIDAIKNGKPVDENGDPLPDGADPFTDPAGKDGTGVVPGSLAPKIGPIKSGQNQVGPNGQRLGNQPQGGQQGNAQSGPGGVGNNQVAGMSLPPLPPGSSKGRNSIPGMPTTGGIPGVPPGTPGGPGVPGAAMITRQEMGEISIVSYEKRAGDSKSRSDKYGKKKATTTVYLPPSYMEATLLSGAYIPTTESAKGNPMPVLLRVKTPAFLPNEAKAAVKGCYIIADGKANLATERAEMTIVSMSCLDKKGRAVIDQKVKGWLIDSDGVAGIGGKVVAKMGTMVARSLIAGFAGGIGDALKAAATTTSVSALGTTQSIDPKDAAMAGVGGGLSNGFKEIQKFYLDLAKQTMPTVAILPSKTVTVAISEGVVLNIKPINGLGGTK
ncbi:TrbI/VirB10 family protein [Pelobacter propionicus]|uniref:TraB pilus assembly family protein n=1 Tax=Pelobacter propionicus (strain DSM 2379 / NBRC 103807 / OttBd1) TaxID=338966 RepID=A0R7R0_PELPD|nr:TrbI/VirB10 family protein [Pelobacter propionicus]ABL01368.1 TraB pilus assembly family protein [Pelobacter propionicus DSM 2379]